MSSVSSVRVLSILYRFIDFSDVMVFWHFYCFYVKNLCADIWVQIVLLWRRDLHVCITLALFIVVILFRKQKPLAVFSLSLQVLQARVTYIHSFISDTTRIT